MEVVKLGFGLSTRQERRKVTVSYEKVIKKMHLGQQEMVREVLKGEKKYFALMAHRRYGKDFLALIVLILCAVKYPGNYYIFAPYFRQAKEIVVDGKTLDGVPMIENLFPRVLLKNPKAQFIVNRSDWSITLYNDSKIFIRGADNPNSNVGVGARGIIYTEAALMKPGFYQYMKPAIDAVINKTGFGVVIFISTPRGKDNWFTRLFVDYFKKFDKHPEIKKLWYVDIQRASESKAWNGNPVMNIVEREKQKAEMLPEIYAQEYECALNTSCMGAYYTDQIAQAIKDKRIGRFGKYEETYDEYANTKLEYMGYYFKHAPLYVSWDIGKRDHTVIWFFQINPSNGNIRFIHHYRNKGVGADHFCEYIKEYVKGKYFGSEPIMILPHDGDVEEWTSTSKRSDYIREFFFNDVRVLSKTDLAGANMATLMAQINKIRFLFTRVEIDSEECNVGLDKLRSYIKKYDKNKQEYVDIPDHDANDKASDDADSFRTAMIYYDLYLKIQPGFEKFENTVFDTGGAITYEDEDYFF